jgi:hypothetical protein
MYCLFCDVLCTVCVCMCTELLPPGGYPIAVKYIISYQIKCTFYFNLRHCFIILTKYDFYVYSIKIATYFSPNMLEEFTYGINFVVFSNKCNQYSASLLLHSLPVKEIKEYHGQLF